jgi:hypothetical protein
MTPLKKQSELKLFSRIIPQAERRGVNDTAKEAKRIEAL